MNVAVGGVVNFRDVGGMPASGGVVRRGVLYRSAGLAAVTDAGRAALAGLGIRRIIDLRGDEEATARPSAVGGLDAVVQRTPLLSGSVRSMTAADATLAGLYAHIVDDSGAAVVDAVRGILAGPALVHCTMGKDRTGVVVALTLRAVGADEPAVVADYARSEALLPAERTQAMLQAARGHGVYTPQLEELIARSPAPVMHELLARVDRDFGSAAGYLAAHGFTAAEQARLRAVLVVSQAPSRT